MLGTHASGRVRKTWPLLLSICGIAASCHAVIGLGELEFVLPPCAVSADCADPDPGEDCVGAECVNGLCMESLLVKAPCSSDGGAVCDVGGRCVECVDDADCVSGTCDEGRCDDPCNNGVEDGEETDIDCGGAVCPRCSWGRGCSTPSDCVTGQCDTGACVACGDTGWVHWPMGEAPDHRSMKEAIRDRVTGLTWQRIPEQRSFSWDEAKAYCELLELAGYTDWRLPRRMEMVSIVDYGRRSPALKGELFGSVSGVFWSSSVFAGDNAQAWYVYFEDGSVGTDDVLRKWQVRCVR